MIRLFLREPLSAGARLELATDKAHYLTRVMRLGPGDEVLLFNGADGEWRARIEQAGRRGLTLGVEAQTRPQAFGPDLELAVALVKRAALEIAVEKATELGVRRIRLVLTERTNAERANLERLALIAAEAAEQCERLEAPEILGPTRLTDVLAGWDQARRLMFCDEAGDAPVATQALAGAADAPWSVLIGPEGGFSPAERAAIRALPAATAVSLGPRILRVDTAAVCALALWQATLGDWRAP